MKPLERTVSRLVREVEELREQRGEVKSKKKEKKKTAATVAVVSGNDAEGGDGDDGAFFSGQDWRAVQESGTGPGPYQKKCRSWRDTNPWD